MRGDPGTSFAQANIGSFTGSQSGQAGVAAQIAPGFAITMFLVGVTAIIAVPLALTLRIVAALYRNSAFDSVANILSLLSISSPEFFLPTS